MPRLPLYQVDAFASCPFQGNPAAVVLLDKKTATLDNKLRQSIAAEMNLSETSFVELPGHAASFKTSSRFKLRWNTPEKEVVLCGHATLAAAAALFSGEGNENEFLVFDTRWSGELLVRRLESNSSFQFAMKLPSFQTHTKIPSDWASKESAIIQALLGKSIDLLDEVRFNELQYLLVALKKGTTRQQLEALQPDIPSCLQAAAKSDIVLAIVTVQGEEGSDIDVLCRVFAPWAGISEDPVTGSAFSVLGPYWAQKLGKCELVAKQCSPRGGDLRVTVDTDEVHLQANAVIVSKGEFLL